MMRVDSAILATKATPLVWSGARSARVFERVEARTTKNVPWLTMLSATAVVGTLMVASMHVGQVSSASPTPMSHEVAPMAQESAPVGDGGSVAD